MISSIDPVDRWFLQRHGKFSASEVYKLLTPPKSTSAVWSPGAITYIEEKAIQSISDLWERPELEETGSLLYGKVHEMPAYEAYIRATRNTSMTYMGTENPIFLEYEPLKEESGGTPDAVNILANGSVDHGAEIKNPVNPVYHFRRLKWTNQFDIKEGYPLCYTQIQKLLMVTNAPTWDFVSYDARQRYTPKKIKIIQVKPDQKFQDNLHVRIEMAIKEKYKLISEHYEVDVKCKRDLDRILK